jgi:signal transduction histidine kinase
LEVEFSTLVHFSKLVSDSTTSDRIFALLGLTVVNKCQASHALVFGTTDDGDFQVLSSYGACDDSAVRKMDLDGVCSLGELEAAVMKIRDFRDYGFRVFPLISDAGLFGALVVLYSESHALDEKQWTLIEGLTELTAISLNKTYQHQKLQKAYDDLRISQDALVRSEKFRALGQMSAGIAHDVKNLLNPLLLYTDHLRDAASNRDEVVQVADHMDRILLRGLETVERLRAFSRQSTDESDAVPTDLNAIVREAVQICKPRLGVMELVVELGSPPITVLRPADCVTAIVNLVFNSIDALQERGRIAIRTGLADGGAWVEVEDNGPGIPPEIRGRILEPFFTTKGDSGTGLGLPIVYAFTQRYGGHLEIGSEPGQGAKFRMWFPASSARSIL